MRAKIFWLVKACNLWRIYSVVYGIWARGRTKKPWILGRVACLGLDTYQLLDTKLRLYNIQKGRVDYLYDVNSGKPETKAVPGAIARYVIRDDIKGLIMQEAVADFSFKTNPELIYMDSYSELTDQLFVSKKSDTTFCCNYSDLHREFAKDFTAEGLLPSGSFVDHYRSFFSLIRKRFGNIPVIFIHFPCKLDNREEFITRHYQIKEAIDTMQTEFQPFFVYDVPVDKVVHAVGDTFPYHYGEQTYQYLKDLLTKNHFNK